MSDAEKLAYIEQLIEEERRLEAHYRANGWDEKWPQASAFLKLARFLRDN